jgi:hypothetical protein
MHGVPSSGNITSSPDDAHSNNVSLLFQTLRKLPNELFMLWKLLSC